MGILTVTGVAAKLYEARGNQAEVARAFGVKRQSVNEFIARHPTLKAVCADCREAMKDVAENALYKAVRKGEAWAVCFYLKTQAKDRGYIERTETRTVTDEDIERDLRELLASGQGSPATKNTGVEEPGKAPTVQ